jgi:CelD/BcsL family acetyltransferase involved in cellulose biosynthesis
VGVILVVAATTVMGVGIWGAYLRFLTVYMGSVDLLSVRPSVMWTLRGTLTLIFGSGDAHDVGALINSVALAGELVAVGATAWLWRGRWDPDGPTFGPRFALTVLLGLLLSDPLACATTRTRPGAILRRVTTATATEPACPGTVHGSPPAASATVNLIARRQSIASITAVTWDALAARNPWATPFSSWAFHRAWWEAYGSTAHDQTMVVVDAEAGPEGVPIGIVPLMHRHEVEPTDATDHTTLRHGSGIELTPVAATAKAVFFGAAYHADYATILAAPGDLERVAAAVVDALAAPPLPDDDHPALWDVVDLRRLRCGDPSADALATAFGRVEAAHGWTLNLEREDVCPVATVPDDAADLDGFLAHLGKKDRHEIRRKVRRAEAAGAVELTPSSDPLADLDAFIDLHQRRWGDAGLFPATPGGDASRRFIRRLFEGFGPDGAVRLCFLTVAGRRIAAGITFEYRDTVAYYNAGVDPDARDLSPGVVMIAKYVERAIEAGRHRLDFLRGDEPYKYEWGAVDEPIQRLLVRRRVSS